MHEDEEDEEDYGFCRDGKAKRRREEACEGSRPHGDWGKENGKEVESGRHGGHRVKEEEEEEEAVERLWKRKRGLSSILSEISLK